jgi:glutamate-1-semialdehyde 2,1-aminomutase
MDAGIPRARARTLRFAYSDLESLRALFAAHPGASRRSCWRPRASRSRPGFLAGVQALCRSEGAVFVLDEMITGFRWHLGGAQKAYGLDPDLSTFGKALANGFALSALCGKREIMRLGGRERPDEQVFLLSTTHGAEIPSLAAAIATMAVYRREPVVEHLHVQGAGWPRGCARRGAARLADHVQVVGRACGLLYVARDRDGQPSQAFRTLLLQETIARGVLAPSLVISYSHSDADVDRTVEAFDGAFAVYCAALEGGVERFLKGQPRALCSDRR